MLNWCTCACMASIININKLVSKNLATDINIVVLVKCVYLLRIFQGERILVYLNFFGSVSL